MGLCHNIRRMTVIELKVVIEESILSIEAEEEDDHFAMQGMLNFI